MAQPSVTLMLAVGDIRPGIFPMALATKMNRPTDPIRGRYLSPLGPMYSRRMPSTKPTRSSSRIWTLPGFSTLRRDVTATASVVMASTTMMLITMCGGMA